jgi:hypothetical protein
MKPWRVYIGWVEVREGQQVVESEDLLSEHGDYPSAKQAALTYLQQWKDSPQTTRYPVRFRIDGDFLALHRSGG